MLLNTVRSTFFQLECYGATYGRAKSVKCIKFFQLFFFFFLGGGGGGG